MALLSAVVLTFVFSAHALGRPASVGAQGVLSASPTLPNGYTLQVANTGDTAISCLKFFVAQGVTVTGVFGPSNAQTTFAAVGISARYNTPFAPGSTSFFQFTTAAAYPANAGGLLRVSADCQTDVNGTVSGPAPATTPPPPTKPCTCASIVVAPDPTLLNKKLRSDQHTFGVGFRWAMQCTAGDGGCVGSLVFSPPVVLAGTIPVPGNNLHLNLKVLRFTCAGPCGQEKTGRFQVQMTASGQLNKLFGRTIAYTISSFCGNTTKVQKVSVFVDKHGVLRAHP